MTRRPDLVAALLAATLAAPAGGAVLITGEVRADNAESIITPPADSSPLVLRFYVPEGQRVKAGDVLVRVDPGASLAQIKLLTSQIEQARARAEKELAELEVKAIDAEKALVDARAALEKARVDAGIPREHLSALDFDRHQGELDRAAREFALKQQEFAAANEAIARRRADGELEVRKLEAERTFNEARVASAEQRAGMDGIVLHGFDGQRGGRYDEGSTAHAGGKIGEVVGEGGMSVRAWVLEPDRAALSEGLAVTLSFDALPGITMGGRVTRIAGAPEPKVEWGDGRYFGIEVALDDARNAKLRPGMSARIAIEPAAAESAP